MGVDDEHVSQQRVDSRVVAKDALQRLRVEHVAQRLKAHAVAGELDCAVFKIAVANVHVLGKASDCALDHGQM